MTAVLPTPAGPVYITHEGDIARADAGDGRIALAAQARHERRRPPDPARLDTLDPRLRRRRARPLVELDLDSGEVLSRATLPEFGAAGGTFVGRQIWITTPNGKLMVLQR